MHARSGGQIEVMGLMMGKIEGDTMIVMDSFALPVEGTETRVNAQNEGYEYMVDYLTLIKQVRLKAKFDVHSCIRLEGKRMLSVGITVILDTDAGFLESMYLHKCSISSSLSLGSLSL